jgi:nucleotide-binding universal stress UspA family protein
MRRVLVPVDGSDNASRALDYAASLARDGVPLIIHLLYVGEDISYGDRSHAFHSNEALERPERERGAGILKASAERVASCGAQLVPELVTGDVAETIISRAEALACHSIIMGMKGHSLLTEILLGSTTMTVLHNTQLPVTLVK